MVTYLALQCYNCKTMQAKQEKKSNNKWNCAICNEKQSLQKVFARSGVAKDIRLFVQNFNFSSHSQQMHQTIPHPQSNSPEFEQKHCFDSSPKQSKWAEYMDDQNLISNGDDDYDDAAFVTIFPDPPQRKRKRQFGHFSRDEDLEFSDGSSTFGGNIENYGSVKPNQKKIHGPANGEERKSIIGKDRPREEGERGGNANGCFVSEKESKWASYLHIDSSDKKCSNCETNDGENELEGGILQTEWQGQVIDEDVHPDFL